jgi:hypothetical protein
METFANGLVLQLANGQNLRDSIGGSLMGIHVSILLFFIKGFIF